MLGSLRNEENKWSGRRITAAVFTIYAGYINVRYTTCENVVYFLLIDVFVILLCLGLVTFEQIIKFKSSLTSKV
jgi:hypothetical protein